jgi:hypothetical protein
VKAPATENNGVFVEGLLSAWSMGPRIGLCLSAHAQKKWNTRTRWVLKRWLWLPICRDQTWLRVRNNGPWQYSKDLPVLPWPPGDRLPPSPTTEPQLNVGRSLQLTLVKARTGHKQTSQTEKSWQVALLSLGHCWHHRFGHSCPLEWTWHRSMSVENSAGMECTVFNRVFYEDHKQLH